MALNLILSLTGGFGLFMYGLKIFSDGLQDTTENTLKEILFKVTQNKILGIVLGFFLTAIVQSSSAVTVMTVSFVNANLLTLTQAINIILGANIGTTVTGWIISLNIDILALPAMGIGAIIVIFSQSRLKFFGYILMGFGMIFYGLILMKNAFLEVRSTESFKNFFLLARADTYAGRFVCILIGALATGIIQSSSAVLGVTISLASVGLIDYHTAVALILGQNIGTTITANLATIGASTNAKRASLIHFLFNTFGVIYIFFLFPYYIKLVDSIIRSNPNEVLNGIYVNVAYHIAAAHTIFNVANVIIFYFLTKYLEKIACIVYKDKEYEKHVSVLMDRLLDMPVSAEIEVRKEVVYMGEVSNKMIMRTESLFENPTEKNLNKIRNYEKLLDNMDKEIHSFLLKLLSKSTINITIDVASLINISTYYENLGDNLKDLAKAIVKGHEKKSLFNEVQKVDILKMLEDMKNYIIYLGVIMSSSYKINRDKVYLEARKKYDIIKSYYYEARQRHFYEVDTSDMPPLNAHLYGDVLVYFNRSLSNLINIVESVTGRDNVMERNILE